MVVRHIEIADSETIFKKRASILRRICTPVLEIDEKVLKIIEDLRDTLMSDTLSVGLAAPQIGYDAAIAIVNIHKQSNADSLILLNPVVLSETGQWDEKYESCMSIPHKRGIVKRRKKVTVRYMDVCGEIQEINLTSFESRVVLHEIDHLNGILFVDRMESSVVLEDTEIFREHGIE